ncbi:class I adenylate-forming enzyme family protein [Mesorhizobium sp. 128a]
MGFGRDVLAAFAGHGDRVAMVSGRDQITYAQALIQIDHLAANFSALGIRSGERVGLAMIGNIDVVLSILACWKLGATVSIADFRAPRSQRAQFAHDFVLTLILESRSPPGDDVYPGVAFQQDWKHASPVPYAGPVGDDTNPAFLMFSSGTTGDPKGYLQSHEALAGRATSHRRGLNGTVMRLLTPMVMSYSATRHQVFSYLRHGGTINFFPPLFTPSELIEGLLSFQASGSALPPPVITRLVREVGERSTRLLPDLAVLFSIGGPATVEDKLAAYRNLSPGYRINYASSLTGGITTLSGADVLAKPSTAGRPFADVRVEILDAGGRVLGKGESGLIKAWTSTMVSAVVSAGNKPFVDPKVMGDGWGIPGDIGFLDEDGFLTIVDREADMIVRGGVNVAPQELEKLIRAHPKVRDVAVAGFPDATMGQEIAAFIVSDQGSVAEFEAFLRANISPDRRPREVRLVTSLPYSDNGKLLRRRLVETLSPAAAKP